MAVTGDETESGLFQLLGIICKSLNLFIAPNSFAVDFLFRSVLELYMICICEQVVFNNKSDLRRLFYVLPEQICNVSNS